MQLDSKIRSADPRYHRTMWQLNRSQFLDIVHVPGQGGMHQKFMSHAGIQTSVVDVEIPIKTSVLIGVSSIVLSGSEENKVVISQERS